MKKASSGCLSRVTALRSWFARASQDQATAGARSHRQSPSALKGVAFLLAIVFLEIYPKLILNGSFCLLFTVKKAHTASLVVSPGDMAEFDVFFHSKKIGRMTGTIHLSVINNQYEETMIHLVGESYEDDITLDNIHGLTGSASLESSEISEVIEIAEENGMDDLVAGGRHGSEALGWEF